MYRFVHVGFAFPRVPKMRDLETGFHALGDDWIRYSALSWILWTEKSTPDLFVRLRPFLDRDDQVLIVPLNIMEAFGTLSPWIWHWINSKAPETTISGKPVEDLLSKYLPPKA